MFMATPSLHNFMVSSSKNKLHDWIFFIEAQVRLSQFIDVNWRLNLNSLWDLPCLEYPQSGHSVVLPDPGFMTAETINLRNKSFKVATTWAKWNGINK